MWDKFKNAIFEEAPGTPTTPQPQGQVTVTASNIKPGVAATISPGVNAEFVAAIREGREPNASVAQVLPCYRVLDALELQLGR